MRRIGLGFTGQPHTVKEIVAATLAAEAAGFESVWIAEDYWTGRDAVSILSCLCLSTTRIRLGTAVINPYTRSPALIAMTLNTLSELAPGRLVLGIGAGTSWRSLVESEMTQRPPMRAMRETVSLIRCLLSGKDGSWRGDKLRLNQSWEHLGGTIPPFTKGLSIYMGVMGPRMTELVGEIGDGLLLGLKARADELPTRIGYLKVGADRATRDVDTITMLPSCYLHPQARTG